jgi:GNAT superfamily N-acetyltransferase
VGDRLAVVPFEPRHVAEAAALAAAHVGAYRRSNPLVPERWQSPAAYEERLAGLVAREPAVVGVVDGRVVGFLAAFAWQRAGLSNVHSPEWANVCVGDGAGAAAAASARFLREELYAALAERWIAAGHTVHHIGLLPDDALALATLAWLGFGHSNVDGLRGLEPVAGAAAGLEIRAAEPVDGAEVRVLEIGLREHLAATPLFFPLDPPPSVDEVAAQLADSERVTLLARDERGPLAYLRVGPASDDAATIIRDEGTASITRAFTRPDRRGGGVATALLDAALGWARERGYVRCSVDYESANLLASRFWTRHFPIVGITVRRRI